RVLGFTPFNPTYKYHCGTPHNLCGQVLVVLHLINFDGLGFPRNFVETLYITSLHYVGRKQNRQNY
ncbi:MAG: hypothetical protein AAFR37_13735, partial [Cyanobacteria bacterium J06628_3]